MNVNSAEFLDAYPVSKEFTIRLVVAVVNDPDAGHRESNERRW